MAKLEKYEAIVGKVIISPSPRALDPSPLLFDTDHLSLRSSLSLPLLSQPNPIFPFFLLYLFLSCAGETCPAGRGPGARQVAISP